MSAHPFLTPPAAFFTPRSPRTLFHKEVLAVSWTSLDTQCAVEYTAGFPLELLVHSYSMHF